EILDLNIKNASQALDFHPSAEMHIIELLKPLKKLFSLIMKKYKDSSCTFPNIIITSSLFLRSVSVYSQFTQPNRHA
ncbi:hypothetical protein EDM27_15880, partial [Staphylococcus aureus]